MTEFKTTCEACPAARTLFVLASGLLAADSEAFYGLMTCAPPVNGHFTMAPHANCRLNCRIEGKKLEEETLSNNDPSVFYPARIGKVLTSKYGVVGKLGFGAKSTGWLALDIQSALGSLISMRL
ncbi:uncharacterized protein Z519_05702 [Cladophialophora bantiana CBS 173.52]|uniref:Uncharacterized protein n=1 Tax=Cladophialophora bantiana (strain ATCC 10958 / CBS 173.52 / CDC B-1940 / NIH 8579) TaxID=1442370 RepID=A0A0D2G352_CLAB1|nr:uncharacterized protein Z519_05702 [Cladophialophora bantiana CBS 173.52]KIW93097.1 hypothetical protein Z519_05702 [Cladophialophora bantiana CBS 173.52]